MEEEQNELRSEQYIRRKKIVSFSVFILFLFLTVAGWKWLVRHDREEGALKPLRKVLYANEKINAAFFSETHLAKEYPVEAAAKKVRVNGALGLRDILDTTNWRIIVYPQVGNKQTLQLTMQDIYKLPEKDIVFEFKCIEGWSQVSHWGGTSFGDFLKHYKLGTKSGNAPDPSHHPEDLYKYVGLMTPDSQYYVGIDMKSILHPQTLLCYKLNDKPLPQNQGFPLRLIIPVKYGVKHLKRIGYIYFSDERPKDYWFKKGYDYDCAL